MVFGEGGAAALNTGTRANKGGRVGGRRRPGAATIEKSSLKKQHPKACTLAKVAEFPSYTFRHTWPHAMGGAHAPVHVGLPGRAQRFLHHAALRPPAGARSVRDAMKRARNGQSGAQTAQSA